jgi:glutathione synthase/RimK-type ligase-like ATP-grasp enzyme
MIRIYAYNKYSVSALALAQELDIYLIKHQNSRYRPRLGDTVINWGLGKDWYPARTINPPDIVALAVNKKSFFNLMCSFGDTAPRIPEFTSDIETAKSWARDGRKVVVRRLLNASEGRGIEIHTVPEEIPEAPLYVKYIPKESEFRIHVVNDTIVDRQRKVLRASADRSSANWEIRNTANNFVFQRNNIIVPQDVETQALLAVKRSGLAFAASDVIWNEHYQKAYVLELNTAPGIEGTTISRYAEALRNMI